MTTAHIPPHIPNTVNHYPSDIGYSHSSEGCQVSSDTRGGAHAGLNCCPHQQWHWGQTHIHTRHLTTAPTSSGTGGRRTTHRECEEWCKAGGEACQGHDSDNESEGVRGGATTEHTDSDTRTQRERQIRAHTQCVRVSGDTARDSAQDVRSGQGQGRGNTSV